MLNGVYANKLIDYFSNLLKLSKNWDVILL